MESQSLVKFIPHRTLGVEEFLQGVEEFLQVAEAGVVHSQVEVELKGDPRKVKEVEWELMQLVKFKEGQWELMVGRWVQRVR
jgi:hypothetical protein